MFSQIVQWQNSTHTLGISEFNQGLYVNFYEIRIFVIEYEI